MKRFSDRRIFILVCLNAALYIPILILDFLKAAGGVSAAQGLASDFLKYAAIVSCLFICIFALSHERKNVAVIQTIVFSITLVADFLLIFTDLFLPGVLVFIGAHACALLRYKPEWLLPVGISAAALFTVVTLALPAAWPPADIGLILVAASCSAYAVLIISLTVSTFHSWQPRENQLFSQLGMLLFLACDVNVFIFNLLPAVHAAYTASIVLMWLFYLPAQTLLALSAVNLPLINRKNI